MCVYIHIYVCVIRICMQMYKSSGESLHDSSHIASGLLESPVDGDGLAFVATDLGFGVFLGFGSGFRV